MLCSRAPVPTKIWARAPTRVHVLTSDVCARGGCASTWVTVLGRIGVNAGVNVLGFFLASIGNEPLQVR